MAENAKQRQSTSRSVRTTEPQHVDDTDMPRQELASILGRLLARAWLRRRSAAGASPEQPEEAAC